MNALGTGLFFLFSALALAGALVAVMAGARSLRGAGMLGVAAGLTGLYAVASAGYAAVLVLIAYGGVALLFAQSNPRSLRAEGPVSSAHQVGAVAAGLLLLVLGYAALRAGLAHGAGPPGSVNAGDVGRLLLGHEALAVEAVGGIMLAALAGAAAFWWGGER